MAKVIKSIAVKQPNGQFGEKIPIGANAVNVKLRDGRNVQAAIDALGDTSAQQIQQIQNALDGKAPKDHATNAETYGIATEQNFGHVKLTHSPSVTMNAQEKKKTAVSVAGLEAERLANSNLILGEVTKKLGAYQLKDEAQFIDNMKTAKSIVDGLNAFYDSESWSMRTAFNNAVGSAQRHDMLDNKRPNFTKAIARLIGSMENFIKHDNDGRIGVDVYKFFKGMADASAQVGNPEEYTNLIKDIVAKLKTGKKVWTFEEIHQELGEAVGVEDFVNKAQEISDSLVEGAVTQYSSNWHFGRVVLILQSLIVDYLAPLINREANLFTQESQIALSNKIDTALTIRHGNNKLEVERIIREGSDASLSHMTLTCPGQEYKFKASADEAFGILFTLQPRYWIMKTERASLRIRADLSMQPFQRPATHFRLDDIIHFSSAESSYEPVVEHRGSPPSFNGWGFDWRYIGSDQGKCYVMLYFPKQPLASDVDLRIKDIAFEFTGGQARLPRELFEKRPDNVKLAKLRNQMLGVNEANVPKNKYSEYEPILKGKLIKSTALNTTESWFTRAVFENASSIPKTGLFQFASEGKKKIATAITGKGQTVAETATFQEMADKIGAIETGIIKKDQSVVFGGKVTSFKGVGFKKDLGDSHSKLAGYSVFSGMKVAEASNKRVSFSGDINYGGTLYSVADECQMKNFGCSELLFVVNQNPAIGLPSRTSTPGPTTNAFERLFTRGDSGRIDDFGALMLRVYDTSNMQGLYVDFTSAKNQMRNYFSYTSTGSTTLTLLNFIAYPNGEFLVFFFLNGEHIVMISVRRDKTQKRKWVSTDCDFQVMDYPWTDSSELLKNHSANGKGLYAWWQLPTITDQYETEPMNWKRGTSSEDSFGVDAQITYSNLVFWLPGYGVAVYGLSRMSHGAISFQKKRRAGTNMFTNARNDRIYFVACPRYRQELFIVGKDNSGYSYCMIWPTDGNFENRSLPYNGDTWGISEIADKVQRPSGDPARVDFVRRAFVCAGGCYSRDEQSLYIVYYSNFGGPQLKSGEGSQYLLAYKVALGHDSRTFGYKNLYETNTSTALVRWKHAKGRIVQSAVKIANLTKEGTSEHSLEDLFSTNLGNHIPLYFSEMPSHQGGSVYIGSLKGLAIIDFPRGNDRFSRSTRASFAEKKGWSTNEGDGIFNWSTFTPLSLFPTAERWAFCGRPLHHITLSGEIMNQRYSYFDSWESNIKIFSEETLPDARIIEFYNAPLGDKELAWKNSYHSV